MFHDTQYCLFWSLALLFLNHPTQVKKPSDNVRFGCKIPYACNYYAKKANYDVKNFIGLFFSFTMFRGKFEQVIDFSRLHLISIEFESGIYSHL